MHAAFVNPGGPLIPDLSKCARYRISRLYWQANDPQVEPEMLAAIRGRGLEVGIMRDPHWDNLPALQLAHRLDADLVRLGADNAQCAVLADIEYHDAAYVQTFLHEWRTLRPRRATGWTLEPLQGGWVTKDLAAMIQTTQVAVFPQAYYGDMTPVDVDRTRTDLIERGIPRGMVAAVYPAKYLPTTWDGIAFRFDQLP